MIISIYITVTNAKILIDEDEIFIENNHHSNPCTDCTYNIIFPIQLIIKSNMQLFTA